MATTSKGGTGRAWRGIPPTSPGATTRQHDLVRVRAAMRPAYPIRDAIRRPPPEDGGTPRLGW
jgi:hypothetical protein